MALLLCRPEFLNRLDEIIVFRQLTKAEVKEIADIMLREVFGRALEKGIKIDVTERFKVSLVLHTSCIGAMIHSRFPSFSLQVNVTRHCHCFSAILPPRMPCVVHRIFSEVHLTSLVATPGSSKGLSGSRHLI